MPKKDSSKSQKPTAAKAVSSPVRNSAIPKTVKKAPAVAVVEITHSMIAVRAFEISMSSKGGSESDNWFAAERELRGI